MALLREGQVYRAARRAPKRVYASADRILKEQTDPQQQRYDIFLSHAVKDAELVLGAKQVLEELGHTVYVDWIDDHQLDRAKVNPKTARVLRRRMKCCETLLYLHSPSSSLSKWMPWELGFFDGHNGKVAILPIVPDTDDDTFRGQEYLGLYPYVDIAKIKGKTTRAAWVRKPSRAYASFSRWKRGAPAWKPAL